LTDFFAQEEVEKIARETGFVNRTSNKLGGFTFLTSLLYCDFDQSQLSLNDLSAQIRDKWDIVLTKQALQERFSDRSVEFMKHLLSLLLKKIITSMPSINILSSFNSLRIKDSTCFQIPECMSEKYPGTGGCSSKAMIRIQFEFDYKTGRVYDLSLHAFNCNDQINSKATIDNIHSGDVIIRDLGYVNIEVLSSIESKGAFYLNRLHSSINVYELKHGKYELVNFVKIQSDLRKRRLSSIEKEVYIGSNIKFKTRMIIELMPKEQIEKRLVNMAKISKKKGCTTSKKHKARVALNIFITNLNSEHLPLEQVRSLYRLRWQIELVFKVWKSVVNIDKVKKAKTQRLETILYSKLIMIMINWNIMWEITKSIWQQHKKMISPIKFFKTLKALTYKSWMAFKEGCNSLAEFIMQLNCMSIKNHILEKRKGQLSAVEIQIVFCVKQNLH